MNPKLTIVRGMPGSGKTTFGRELSARQNALFIEPDMYLYDANGIYQYNERDYHGAICNACAEIVNYFTFGGKFAVYADVLPTVKDVQKIQRMSRLSLRIDFTVIDMPMITFNESKLRNVHNVCDKDLKLMFDLWEDWK